MRMGIRYRKMKKKLMGGLDCRGGHRCRTGRRNLNHFEGCRMMTLDYPSYVLFVNISHRNNSSIYCRIIPPTFYSQLEIPSSTSMLDGLLVCLHYPKIWTSTVTNRRVY